MKLQVLGCQHVVGFLHQNILGTKHVLWPHVLACELQQISFETSFAEEVLRCIPIQLFETLQGTHYLHCFLDQRVRFGHGPHFNKT